MSAGPVCVHLYNISIVLMEPVLNMLIMSKSENIRL